MRMRPHERPQTGERIDLFRLPRSRRVRRLSFPSPFSFRFPSQRVKPRASLLPVFLWVIWETAQVFLISVNGIATAVCVEIRNHLRAGNLPPLTRTPI